MRQAIIRKDEEESLSENHSELVSVKEEVDDLDLTLYDGTDKRDDFFYPDQTQIPTKKRKLEQKTDWDDEEFTLFGKQVALRLKNLPTAHAKIMVQHVINTVLFEGELGKYNYPKDSAEGRDPSLSCYVPNLGTPSTSFQCSPGSQSFNSETVSVMNFPRRFSPGLTEDLSVDDVQ